MNADKIVLLVLTSGQGDILKDYLEWHLDLGVDLILAEDVGSSDNTHEILESFSKRGLVRWSLVPDRNRSIYRGEEMLVKAAIEEHGADWIIMSDVDEFLCAPVPLRTILETAAADGFTAISVPCFNMTGPPLPVGKRATEAQTLRIDRPAELPMEEMVSGDISVPYVFVKHPPKTITRAPAFAGYGPGMHSVATSFGTTSHDIPGLRFLHYPIRGFDTLQAKVAAGSAFFEENTHLEPWWSWHWRRWIRLNQAGLLREDYDREFVTPERMRELIRDGVCSVDETIENWIKESDRRNAT